MKGVARISENCMESIAELNNLRDSLQREFEYFAGSADITVKDKQLRAKKIQIDYVNGLKKLNESNFEQLEIIQEKIFQLEACLICYGVSFSDILFFMNRNSEAINLDAKRAIENRGILIPTKIMDVIDFEHLEKLLQSHEAKAEKRNEEPKKPAVFTEKPILGLKKIYQLINKQPTKNEKTSIEEFKP